LFEAVARGSSIWERGDRSAVNRLYLALVDYVRQIADGARPLLATSMNSSTVEYLHGNHVRWALTLDWTRSIRFPKQVFGVIVAREQVNDSAPLGALQASTEPFGDLNEWRELRAQHSAILRLRVIGDPTSSGLRTRDAGNPVFFAFEAPIAVPPRAQRAYTWRERMDGLVIEIIKDVVENPRAVNISPVRPVADDAGPTHGGK
jgi:hypothetical protein